MASTEWFIDGAALKRGRVRDVESRAGWHNVTALGGQNLQVPNRAGEIFMPKTVSAGGFALSLWLDGGNEDTLRDEFDLLLRTVVQPRRMLTVQKRYPDGEVRVCLAELIGGVRPTTVGRRGMRAVLSFKIPSGIWESDRWYEHRSVAGAALPQEVKLPSLARSTAPMDNAILTVIGPITNPIVGWSNPAYGIGDQVRYVGTVPNGASLELDAGTWGIKGSGFSPNAAAVIPSGSRLMSIAHSNAPALTLSGVGGGASTQLAVRSKLAFIAT